MAQIAFMIERFRQSFFEKPQEVKLDGFLLVPKEGEFVLKTTKEEKPKKPKLLECGSELVKDPKWAKVNTMAKMAWTERLGVKVT